MSACVCPDTENVSKKYKMCVVVYILFLFFILPLAVKSAVCAGSFHPSTAKPALKADGGVICTRRHPQEGKLQPSVCQQAGDGSSSTSALARQLTFISSRCCRCCVYVQEKIPFFFWSRPALQGWQSACVCKEQLCKPMQS